MKYVLTSVLTSVFVCFVCFLFGCSSEEPISLTSSSEHIVTDLSDEEFPTFVHTASEYPSWSTYMVAAKSGLINPVQGGNHGLLEKKHNVDIVLQVKDYDPCITLYANGSCDSTCLTNMDVLNPSMSRPTTVILPTSTSNGADKIISNGEVDLDELKSIPVYGLEKSVSHYCFYRCLESNKKEPSEYDFKNIDPSPASTALQTNDSQIRCISVWNPFALQTLRNNKNTVSIMDSSMIPEEIIDCVVIGNDSLEKEGGERFAACLCEIFYMVNEQINHEDSKISNAALTALGEDFSRLPLEDMRLIVKETKFYNDSEAGIALFESDKFKNETMPMVVKTCKSIGVLDDESPSMSFDEDNKAQLGFTTKFMKMFE